MQKFVQFNSLVYCLPGLYTFESSDNRSRKLPVDCDRLAPEPSGIRLQRSVYVTST